MKVLLLSRYDRLGSSSRTRFYQYLPYLAAAGVEATVAPLLDDGYVSRLYAGAGKSWGAVAAAYGRRLRHLSRVRRFDVAWIEKELFPMLPAWGELVLHRLGVPTVVDYDDAVFHHYDRHKSSFVRATLGGKIDTVMANATLVLAGNAYLAGRAREAGARWVEELPSVIDLDRYPPPRERQRAGFAMGWIGSPVTTKYLKLIEAPLRALCREEGTRLVTIGAGPVALDGVRLEQRPWSEATEVDSLTRVDVGIMPLSDAPFERGKCGYKLVQYMACGLPVVAPPVGANSEIIEHGINGFLVRSDDEWIAALAELRASAELRARMGTAGRKKVEERYSVQVTAPRLERLLRQAAQGRCRRSAAQSAPGIGRSDR